jgi:hypothetical protein
MYKIKRKSDRARCWFGRIENKYLSCGSQRDMEIPTAMTPVARFLTCNPFHPSVYAGSVALRCKGCDSNRIVAVTTADVHPATSIVYVGCARRPSHKLLFSLLCLWGVGKKNFCAPPSPHFHPPADHAPPPPPLSECPTKGASRQQLPSANEIGKPMWPTFDEKRASQKLMFGCPMVERCFARSCCDGQKKKKKVRLLCHGIEVLVFFFFFCGVHLPIMVDGESHFFFFALVHVSGWSVFFTSCRPSVSTHSHKLR